MTVKSHSFTRSSLDQPGKYRPSGIRSVLLPKNGLKVFVGGVLFSYAFLPLVIYNYYWDNPNLLFLAELCFLSVFFMFAGSKISLFDHQIGPSSKKLVISEKHFMLATWVAFTLFAATTIASAPSIPLITAIQGADASTLSAQRGDFLKTRSGIAGILPYLNTFFMNTIIPYSIILAFQRRRRWAKSLIVYILLYSISFLVKALFLNVVLPVTVYFALAGRLSRKGLIFLLTGVFAFLLFGFFVTSSGENEKGIAFDEPASVYFSSKYRPDNSRDKFVWRVLSVPVFTASDTLIVHELEFGGKPLLGATSSVISALSGMERINLERHVFAYQFGGWSDRGNANSVFFVGAFANFGYLGVVLFSLFVGLVFRWFRLSSDPVFQCLWTLFGFVLFSGSLIGMLLSNGFLFMLFFAWFVRIRGKS